MRLTEKELIQIQLKHNIKKMRSPAKRGPARGMNKTETRHSEILEILKRNGDILSWKYEPIKLRIADNTYYVPDFLVKLSDGTLEFHEIKGGFIREKGWVKFKVAAELFPEFDFKLWQCIKGEWRLKYP